MLDFVASLRRYKVFMSEEFLQVCSSDGETTDNVSLSSSPRRSFATACPVCEPAMSLRQLQDATRHVRGAATVGQRVLACCSDCLHRIDLIPRGSTSLQVLEPIHSHQCATVASTRLRLHANALPFSCTQFPADPGSFSTPPSFSYLHTDLIELVTCYNERS